MPKYDDIDEQIRELTRSLPGPKVWHVIWVIPVGKFFGVFFEFAKLITDRIFEGHEYREDAEHAATVHKYHRRFDAWLFNAKTGEAHLVESEMKKRARER